MKRNILWMGMLAIALALSMVFFASCLTPQKADPELLKYSEVVSVADAGKEELFAKVNLWLINALKEEESKIQRSDGAEGVITATHTYWTYWGAEKQRLKTLVLTTITITVRDNGYTLNFSNPIFKCRTVVGPYTPDGWTKTVPLDGTLVADTRNVWFDLAGGLRSAVSGTLVSN